jgi:hypothetical protein
MGLLVFLDEKVFLESKAMLLADTVFLGVFVTFLVLFQSAGVVVFRIGFQFLGLPLFLYVVCSTKVLVVLARIIILKRIAGSVFRLGLLKSVQIRFDSFRYC